MATRLQKQWMKQGQKQQASGAAQAPAQVAQPPQNGSLPTSFTGHTQHLLSGAMLNSNPHLQAGVLDPARREANRTYAAQQAQLAEAAEGGGGAWGGDIHQAMMARQGSAHQQNLADQQNAILAGNYNSERDRMMEALAGLGGYETAGLDRAAQVEISALDRAAANSRNSASISAQLEGQRRSEENALALQGNQLDYSRQGLAFDAMQGMRQGDLAEAQFMANLAGQGFSQDFALMQLMGQMGMGAGQQNLDALGMVPGLEGAGYVGFGNAMGAEGQVNAQDAAAAAERAQIDAQNAQNDWQFNRDNEVNSFGTYLNQLLGISGAGAVGSNSGTTPGGPAGPNPWVAGIGQGLSAWQQLRGLNSSGGAAGAGYFGQGSPTYPGTNANPFGQQGGYDPWGGQGGQSSSPGGGGGSSGGGSSPFSGTWGGFGTNALTSTNAGQGQNNSGATLFPFEGYPTPDYYTPPALESGGPFVDNSGTGGGA